MIYVKSVLAGLLTVLIGSIVLPMLGIIGIIFYNAIHSAPDEGAVGWDPISLTKHPPLLLIAFIVICFSAGFLWEYRRLVR